MNLRPLGRSTITKVASPHINYEQSRQESKSIAGAAQRSVDELTTEEGQNEAFVVDEGIKVIDDNSPFNWYFQHYNDTNLEPYVGIAYGGAVKNHAYGWSFLLVFGVLL